MTVSDLIAKLSFYPPDARVTLLDPEKRWLLPIEIKHLSADDFNCGFDFIAVTADSASDEIEGMANYGVGPASPSSERGEDGHPKIQQREA